MKQVRIYSLLFLLSVCTGTVYSQNPISVSIISPSNNSNILPGSTVVLTALVSDTTSPISAVIFKSGENSIIGNGSLNGSVYSYNWTNIAAGNYTIRAIVNDILGNTQSSALITFTVDSTSVAYWEEGGNSFGKTSIFGTNDSNSVTIQTNGQRQVTILPNGNVGIGRIDPSAQLHTTGTVRFDNYPNDETSDYLLSTDTSGNLELAFMPARYFDNGLFQNGPEVSLGGNYGMSAVWNQSDWNTSQYVYGNMLYDNNAGDWEMFSTVYADTALFASGSSFNNFTQSFNLYTSTTNQSSQREVANIYAYSGAGGAGISLTTADSLSGYNSNGIQLYSMGMDLNTPEIQFNYFPNNSAGDLILTTDSLGKLIQKPFSYFSGNMVTNGPLIFDNGLTQNGNEVSIGGTNGMDAFFSLNDFDSENINGEIFYNKYGYWDINTQMSTDSTYYASDLSIGVGKNNPRFDLYSELDNSTSSSVEIYGYTGFDGPGISLNVSDSLNINTNNGLQIYDMGIDLNTPIIQFNYFPNDSAKDLILTTDSVGNLVQKPFSSFGNITSTGRWNYSGSSLYDTLDNIGIGTSNPQSRLSVNGTITSKKVVVSQNGWPDYVFDSTYFLLPLNKLKKYIDQNKHLPDMPATADVSKSGIDLGDNQAALLKKVEELTLYAIEQNRKQETQQKIIDEQMKMLVEMKNEIEKLKKKTN